MQNPAQRLLLSILIPAFFFLLPFTAYSQILNDTIPLSTQVNMEFGQIYKENAPTLFFGNEYGGAEKTLLVTDLNPNVVVLNSKKSRFFFLFSPRVNLRLLSAYKSPVRSPSYMPGGTLYTRLNDDTSKPKFISLSYTHHSNGQRGPTLNEDGSFNRGEGKFTTNFYRLDYYIGKRKNTATLSSSQYASIGIELHTGLFKTGYSEELKDKYGFVRANGSWMYDFMRDRSGTNDEYTNHQRIRFDFTYIFDKIYNYNIADVSKRLNASIKYLYQFGFMENAAITATAGYRGQDPYNIYFEDSYPYFAVGIAAGVSFRKNKK
jgi:hypothetical protein